MTNPRVQPDPALGLLATYDTALPHVYGYLLARCGDPTLAEELAAETFLAAVGAVRREDVRATTPWLIGIARHKLVDHWRRRERDARVLRLASASTEELDDPWDARLEAAHAREVLGGLGAHHQAALTLRYLDGLPVAEVAALLDRSLHATEALLVRARRAFRHAYEVEDRDDD